MAEAGSLGCFALTDTRADAAAGLSKAAKTLALWLFGCLLIIPIIWNQFVGISWSWPGNGELALVTAALGALTLYAAVRKLPRLPEIAGFVLLSLLSPIFGVRLSYLAATPHFPLIDAWSDRLDTGLGFHWANLAAWESSHPQFLDIQDIVYQSPIFIAVVSVVAFTILQPNDRNYEMLFILIAGLLVATLIFAFVPSFGPASLLGMVRPHQPIMDQLRSGQGLNLPYTGIISFPSYHTMMAVSFIYCHRGIKQTFGLMLIWNLAMLATISFDGDHYLSDMIAGAAVAGLIIAVSRPIFRRPSDRVRTNRRRQEPYPKVASKSSTCGRVSVLAPMPRSTSANLAASSNSSAA